MRAQTLVVRMSSHLPIARAWCYRCELSIQHWHNKKPAQISSTLSKGIYHYQPVTIVFIGRQLARTHRPLTAFTRHQEPPRAAAISELNLIWENLAKLNARRTTANMFLPHTHLLFRLGSVKVFSTETSPPLFYTQVLFENRLTRVFRNFVGSKKLLHRYYKRAWRYRRRFGSFKTDVPGGNGNIYLRALRLWRKIWVRIGIELSTSRKEKEEGRENGISKQLS
ncbi:hypothetical protein B0T09DRAFT_176944 [Sordaria sp. MPI-SDFR-AT-0083]|nr:hypothetical protein B0T09DRAFT_176944 [Sordaria sp. MPI-SDFR-AT-0083]